MDYLSHFFMNQHEGVKEKGFCRVPVAHVYNPSYSGGRDQEDRNLKLVQANSL
jgi:hypothetical protein